MNVCQDRRSAEIMVDEVKDPMAMLLKGQNDNGLNECLIM